MQPFSAPKPPTFGEFIDNARRLEERMRKGQDELEKAVVTGRSQDGTVVAVSTGLGRLQAVRVDPGIYERRDVASLQRAIMEAMRAAGENAAALAAEKMGPVEINLH